MKVLYTLAGSVEAKGDINNVTKGGYTLAKSLSLTNALPMERNNRKSPPMGVIASRYGPNFIVCSGLRNIGDIKKRK